MHLSAHPAFHQTDLLSSFRFQYHCTLTGTAYSQISRFEFFSVFHNFAYHLCVQLRRYWAVMNHAVARFAQPCQIGNFIDSFDWKLVVDVVTVFWNCYGKWFPAAFALSLIPVIGVFPVHEVFKVCFPALSVCIAGKGDILRGVDGWPVTGQQFVFVPVVHIRQTGIYCAIRAVWTPSPPKPSRRFSPRPRRVQAAYCRRIGCAPPHFFGVPEARFPGSYH